MNRMVENLSRIRRSAVAGRRALFGFDQQCSRLTECATGDDQGATDAQQGFHNV